MYLASYNSFYRKVDVQYIMRASIMGDIANLVRFDGAVQRVFSGRTSHQFIGSTSASLYRFSKKCHTIYPSIATSHAFNS